VHKLPAGQSFTLFYRVLIHPGRAGKERLEKEYQAFVTLPHPAKR
jgi:hypothetical protein